MANDQRMNMQMQVEDVKRAIAQETDPQKKAELAQHGAAYLEDLAKQNPEAYQSVLQANRRQGQAQQGQGGSILRPANPEDGLVDIRQSRAKSSGYLGTPAAEAQKQAWIQRQQLVNPSIVSGDTPVSPQGSIVKQPYQPLGPNPQTTNVPEQSGYSQAEQDAMMSQYDARDQMQAKARQDALDLQNFRRNQGNKTPVEQQGIFDRIGSGLKSVGRGMGQYTEKLFNDPNRMAMLQGGLSMMNPNSYYDKQGFGSVFQGLETGLGQAQKGMKGVLDRRKAISDQALVDAKAKQERLGVGKEGEYRSMVTQFLNLPDGDPRKALLGRRIDQLAPQAESGKKMSKAMEKQAAAYIHEGAKTADGTLSSLRNYTNILDTTIDSKDGIITGPGTEGVLWLGRFLSEKMGMKLMEGDAIDNTNRYIAGMGTMVGEIIKQFGSGTGLSDADREFARMISAQDPSGFSKEAIKGVLALNEMRMRADLLEHNDRVAQIKQTSRGATPAYLTKPIPPMSKNLRQHIKNRMAGKSILGEKGGFGSYNDDGEYTQQKPVGWINKTENEWENMVKAQKKASSGGFGGYTIKSVKRTNK